MFESVNTYAGLLQSDNFDNFIDFWGYCILGKVFRLEGSCRNWRLQDKLVHWQTKEPLWCSQIINDDNGLLCCFYISMRAFLSSDTIFVMTQVCKAIGLVRISLKFGWVHAALDWGSNKIGALSFSCYVLAKVTVNIFFKCCLHSPFIAAAGKTGSNLGKGNMLCAILKS